MNRKMIDTNHLEEIVDEVVVISELPGGFGQFAQALPEPIEILKFKTVEIAESLRPPNHGAGRSLTSSEVKYLVKQQSYTAVAKNPRNCRKCRKGLSTDRARFCKTCKPSLATDPGHFIYCEVSGE